MLVLALVLGALAAAGVWMYLSGVERRAFRGARLVPVLVVENEIKRHTSGDQALAEGRIRPSRIPLKFRPGAAIIDPAEVRGKVARADLLAGQIVGTGHFVDRTVTKSTFAERIPEGQVAITIELDQTRGVADLIEPGDRVNILVVGPDGARLLYQGVDVIAIGAGSAATNGSREPTPGNRSLFTFAVPLLAAERIALAATTAGPGGLYLTLLPPNSPAVSVPPVSPAGLFQGSPTPYT